MYHHRTKAAVIGSALAGGAALALLAPASPALAFDSNGLHLDISVQSPATLVARGVAVDVPVEVECNSGDASVDIHVTERVGSRIITGYSYQRVACTGAPQLVMMRVETSSGRPFAKGTALATANIFACNSTTCGSETSSVTIKIVK